MKEVFTDLRNRHLSEYGCLKDILKIISKKAVVIRKGYLKEYERLLENTWYGHRALPPTNRLIIKDNKFQTEWKCKPKCDLQVNERPVIMKAFVSGVYV